MYKSRHSIRHQCTEGQRLWRNLSHRRCPQQLHLLDPVIMNLEERRLYSEDAYGFSVPTGIA